MSKLLSIPPHLDDAAVHALEAVLARPAKGELVVLAARTESFSAYGLVNLRAMVDAERLRGDRVTIEPPLNPVALQRLIASGFTADLGLELVPEPDRLPGGRWQGVRMRRITSPGDVVAFTTDAWRTTRPHGRRLSHTVLQVVDELAGNSLEHAEDPLGAIGILEVRRGRLELAVVDRGIGVRAALERGGRTFATDIDALFAALGLSKRDAGTIGLPVLRRLVGGHSDLSLTLRSGHGEVRIVGAEHGINEWGHQITGFSGVLRKPV